MLAFITSVVSAPLEPSDLLIDPGQADFARTGLKVRSVLRLHRMITVPSRIIQRQLGLFHPISRPKFSSVSVDSSLCEGHPRMERT